jgi:acetylornithine deacetylase/succinyl-diaminopimelate desuccinylase-like protein
LTIDWQSIGDEAAQLLSRYIQIDTTNPPGNERRAADFLAVLLKDRGIAHEVHESAPGRANVVARLPGEGDGGALVLLHHMDVVPADPDPWSCAPFGGEVRDGHVWGRGAIDMKGAGIMHLLALDLLKREGGRRARDILYLAVSDEEMGGVYGTQWVLDHLDGALPIWSVWDEGGFGLRDFFGPTKGFGPKPVFTVAVAEKQVLWLRLVAEGEPGHGGLPHNNNANDTLVHALHRLVDYETPLRVHQITDAMFKRIASTLPFPQSWLLRHLDTPWGLALARGTLTSDKTINAMLRNTLSLTGLHAGGKANVIPERAEAILDVRLLPGEEPDAFVASLETIVADERVQIEIMQRPEPSTVSALDHTLFQAMADATTRLVPGSVTVPMLTPGATDSAFFRRRGIDTYGMFPAIITPTDMAGLHGIDERISIENLRFGTRLVYEVLRDVCLT